MKRYADTVRLLAFLAITGVVVGLGQLWRPSLWIVIGITCIVLVVLTVRNDRRRQR